MKVLDKQEIKQMADALMMTEQDTQEVADIFVKILAEEQNGNYGWKIHKPLNDVDDYIREWEDHWHREENWQEYYDYESNNFFYDYEMAEKVFETLETFKDNVAESSYELGSGLIIIVC